MYLDSDAAPSRNLMKIQWSKLLLKTVVWLGAELTLTCLGLDDLADYCEFIFQDRRDVLAHVVSISLVTSD